MAATIKKGRGPKRIDVNEKVKRMKKGVKKGKKKGKKKRKEKQELQINGVKRKQKRKKKKMTLEIGPQRIEVNFSSKLHLYFHSQRINVY